MINDVLLPSDSLFSNVMPNGRYNFQRLKQVDPLWGSILGMENNIIKFWNDQPEKTWFRVLGEILVKHIKTTLKQSSYSGISHFHHFLSLSHLGSRERLSSSTFISLVQHSAWRKKTHPRNVGRHVIRSSAITQSGQSQDSAWYRSQSSQVDANGHLHSRGFVMVCHDGLGGWTMLITLW